MLFLHAYHGYLYITQLSTYVNLVVTCQDERLDNICHILLIGRYSVLQSQSNMNNGLTLYIYAASYSIPIDLLTCRFIGSRNTGTFYSWSLHMTMHKCYRWFERFARQPDTKSMCSRRIFIQLGSNTLLDIFDVFCQVTKIMFVNVCQDLQKGCALKWVVMTSYITVLTHLQYGSMQQK